MPLDFLKEMFLEARFFLMDERSKARHTAFYAWLRKSPPSGPWGVRQNRRANLLWRSFGIFSLGLNVLGYPIWTVLALAVGFVGAHESATKSSLALTASCMVFLALAPIFFFVWSCVAYKVRNLIAFLIFSGVPSCLFLIAATLFGPEAIFNGIFKTSPVANLWIR